MAIENASGGTLADLIKRRCGTNSIINSGPENEKKSTENQTLSEDDCAKIIRGILQGLQHIHSFDYVHRDIKPSNVVIDDINDLQTVKIVDFGLAIKVHLKHGLDDECGTLVYSAPEQIFGEKSYGKPIDLWAVGFVMYELICG